MPPFSGPRSRAAVADCNPQPHQHRCALQPWGATANGACARGHPHRPDASAVACHAFACHARARAGGLGYGRRHHSRWPRPSHDQTLLMARRQRTENGAPRAWAEERAPGHLPLLHACMGPAANISNWPSAACRPRQLARRSTWGSAFRGRTWGSERPRRHRELTTISTPLKPVARRLLRRWCSGSRTPRSAARSRRSRPGST